MFFVCFFFFKQKTAYEMRISDLSSDVCSSDLIGRGFEPFGAAEARLKGDLDRAPEQVGKQARGLLALAMIGIAEFQRALRHAVEAREQHVGDAIERGQPRFDRRPKRVQIDRKSVV